MSLLERSGEACAAALLISMGSGFVVAYQYDTATPFVSTVAIASLLPWGWMWRAMHFWSSQLFLLLLLIHTWHRSAEAVQVGNRRGGKRYWAILSITLPLGVFALFTGYVLRFDETGRAASSIAGHLFVSIPLFGQWLDRLLMSVSLEGVQRVYVVHVAVTALLWGIGTWYHTRRVLIKYGLFVSALLFILPVSLVVPAPMDLPGAYLDIIKGPWFFLGVQELLRYMPPLAAGVVFPMIPMALLMAMPLGVRWKRGMMAGIAAWLMIYGLLTIAMIAR